MTDIQNILNFETKY